MKDAKFLLSLMTPRAWTALLLAALLLLIAGLGVGGVIGYRVASGQAEIRALEVEGERAAERFAHQQDRLAHEKRLAVEVEKVAATEKRWRDHVGEVAKIHQQEKDDAKHKIDSLRADVLTGAVRLSVAVKAARAAAGSCPASQGAAAAGGDQEARAELVPQAAYDLIGIAADGDDAVRDLNACIDAYEAIRLPKESP